MRSRVVVDANLLLKLVLAEEGSDLTQALWGVWIANDYEVLAPDLIAFEATSVLRNYVHRGLLNPEEGLQAFTHIHAQAITCVPSQNLNARAWELASEYGRPTAYDAYYLALAELTGCELWTADRRLLNAVRAALPWVKGLDDFRPLESKASS